jgi:hypothetical protein
MRWAGHVAVIGKEIRLYKVLVGKPEGKRPLGRPRSRWEEGITTLSSVYIYGADFECMKYAHGPKWVHGIRSFLF